MSQVEVRERPDTRTGAQAEATAISRWTAALSGVLVLGAGVLVFLGQQQASGLALFGALAMSIASVAGRPARGWRWLGPTIIGTALLVEAVASLP